MELMNPNMGVFVQKRRRIERKKGKQGGTTMTEHRKVVGVVLDQRGWQEEEEEDQDKGVGMGDHQSFLASSLKATSLSFPAMISLSDPT